MREHRATSTTYREAQRQGKVLLRQTPKGRALYRSTNQKRKQRLKVRVCHDLLRRIYEMCPEGYRVDHIVPLSKGGMHDPSNLQYLPAAVNGHKAAKLDFDCSAHLIRWQDILPEPSTTIPSRE